MGFYMARTRRKWGMRVDKTLTFRRGVHPREAAGGKLETRGLPIESAAAPSVVAVPLSQHVGAPAKPLVRPGTPVLMGQKIAAPDGFVSAAVHSPVRALSSPYKRASSPAAAAWRPSSSKTTPWTSGILP